MLARLEGFHVLKKKNLSLTKCFRLSATIVTIWLMSDKDV